MTNHIWDINGDTDINQTFLQPFVSYTTSNALTLSLNSEATYDWEAERWIVPINLVATKVINVGNQLISVGGGVRYWADGPIAEPEGWGARLSMTFLFPR